MAGVLFAKTYFEKTAPNTANTLAISTLAEKLYSEVKWNELFCSKLIGDADYAGGTHFQHFVFKFPSVF